LVCIFAKAPPTKQAAFNCRLLRARLLELAFRYLFLLVSR